MPHADAYHRFDATLREPIRQFAGHLQQLAGGQAIGLTIYGAALDADSAASLISDDTSRRITSVLSVETVDLEMLRRLAIDGAKLHRTRFAPPLVMTGEMIRRSLDSFPLELLEIHQQHATVLGDDPFAALEFEAQPLRVQCERELRSMALAMRQALLVSGGEERALDELQRYAGDGLLRVLRGLLWLRDEKSFVAAERAISASEATAGRPLAACRAAIERRGHTGWEHFKRLYAEIEALGNLADAS
ncbi:MAG TPA: hypothetical protein VHZ24_03900 [Pirellulales bacterium]|jgi:hypothetical protein|nr:hypothetical protein [Pirellulales bacterium]